MTIRDSGLLFGPLCARPTPRLGFMLRVHSP